MYELADIHRFPRAGVDPIDCPGDALRLFAMLMSSPMRHETIALLLDRERRGHSILVVDRTFDPDSLLGIVDMVAETAAGDPLTGGLVVATVRPHGAVDDDDLDRWDDADDTCVAAGLDLVEWFVLGSTISCPRALRGIEPRWAG